MAKKKQETTEALASNASGGIRVELKPHIGYRKSQRYGRVPVKLQQDLIYVNGIHCGYVAHHPGAPINLLEPPPDDIAKAIVEQVTAVRGKKPSKIVGAPSDSQVAETLTDE